MVDTTCSRHVVDGTQLAPLASGVPAPADHAPGAATFALTGPTLAASTALTAVPALTPMPRLRRIFGNGTHRRPPDPLT